MSYALKLILALAVAGILLALLVQNAKLYSAVLNRFLGKQKKQKTPQDEEDKNSTQYHKAAINAYANALPRPGESTLGEVPDNIILDPEKDRYLKTLLRRVRGSTKNYTRDGDVEISKLEAKKFNVAGRVIALKHHVPGEIIAIPNEDDSVTIRIIVGKNAKS